MANNETKEVVLSTINKMIQQGGDENFAVFNLGSDYYIQIAAARGDTEMLCEAVSNNYIKSSNVLSAKQMTNLLELGWHAPQNDTDNYNLMYAVGSNMDKNNLVDFICSTAEKVYFRSAISKNDVTINLE